MANIKQVIVSHIQFAFSSYHIFFCFTFKKIFSFIEMLVINFLIRMLYNKGWKLNVKKLMFDFYIFLEECQYWAIQFVPR
jgi:hypothetical protein